MSNYEVLISELQNLKKENQALRENIIESAQKKELCNELLVEYAKRIDAIFWRFDIVNDKWLFVSDNAENVLGFKPEEWGNFEWWVERIHPEDREWVPNFCILESKNNRAHSMEYRMIHKDGSIVWVIDQVGVHNVNGEVLFLYGIMIDITERKNFEQKLKEKNNHFDSISSASPDPLLVTRVSDGFILYANHKCAEIVGMKLEDLIGKTTPDFYLNKSDRQMFIDKLTKDGYVNELEIQIKKIDGTILWTTFNSKIGNYEGSTAIYTALRDISDRKIEEEKMKKLTMAVEQSFASIVITDKNGIIEYVNPKFSEISGYSYNEVIGKTPRILKSGKHPKDFYSEMWSVLNAGIHWIGELLNRRKNGELYWELTSISPMKNNKGEITHFVSVKEDITEKKNAENEMIKKNKMIEIQFENNLKLNVELHNVINELRIAKEQAEYNEIQHKALIENAIYPIIITNFEGYVRYTNDAALELFDLDANQLSIYNGKDFWVDANQRNILVNELLSKGKKLNFETHYKDTKGEVLFLEASTHLISYFNENCIFTIFNNLTERKKYESELFKLDASLKAIIENTLDSIWSINRNYEIVYVNDVFKNAFYNNFGVELYPGVNIYKSLPSVIADVWKERYDRAFTGERFIFEDAIPINEELTIYVEVAVNPILLDDEVTGASFFARDITNKKLAELELKKQNEQIERQYEEYMQLNEVLRNTNYELEIAKSRAEEGDKLKTAILQNITHEIRTPLNGIIGFTKLLKSDDLEKEERDEYIALIQLSGKRLIEMVNNVIEISKISTKQVSISNSEFSINSLLEDLYSTFNPIASDQNLKLTYKGIANFNKSLINADEGKLTIILSNLISNAIKFTNIGSIEFGCIIKENIHNFYVKDTGVGIAIELQDKIFESFTQADVSISRNYEGAGLGLAICKGLVNLLGGQIWLESELGKGSTFWFSLPDFR